MGRAPAWGIAFARWPDDAALRGDTVKGYSEKLAERVLSQASACIGCNDCLLACPIPESRSITIAELNAAMRLPVIRAEHVVAFLSACTQCKQCVPACPADLNRAEMVLFNKLKVEDAIPNHKLLLQARERVSPSGFTLDGLSEGLAALELFRGAPPQALRRLVQKSTLRRLETNEVLSRDGDFYEHLVIVLSGSLVQTSTGPKGELFYLVGLGPGSFLGEVGVLGDCPEPYGAVARETSVVLESPKLAVLRLMEQAPSFAETLDREYARHALWNHARKPGGSLGTLPEAAILELFADARLELVPAGQPLFREGEPPRDFFLVRSGFLRAVKRDATGERVLTYFREGDALGLAGLLARETEQRYAAHAVGRAEVVRVTGEALGRLFARYPDAYPKLHAGATEAERLARSAEVGVGPMNFALDVPESRLSGRPSAMPPSAMASGVGRASSPPSHDRVSSARAAFASTRAKLETGVFVEEGLAKGREVLVVDQNLCTSCGNCIDACERRHGTSRLQLRGLQVENY